MTRDERQKECIRRWVKAGGNASIVASTGFGKTRIALDIIDLLVKKNPDLYVIIVVPTDFLKEQWEEQLFNRKLYFNCSVQIINSVIKQNQECDLLIQDECHLFASQQFKRVFQKIKYKLILCLTGTLERLDGKEEIIKKYAPVCDRITLTIAEKNGWVSHVNEYVVLLNVDLSEYNEVNKKFNSYFAFFNFDFKIGMACLQDPKYRNSYAKTINIPANQLAAIAADWMRCLRVRKTFIQFIIYIVASIFAMITADIMTKSEGIFGATTSYFITMFTFFISYVIVQNIEINKIKKIGETKNE